MTPTSGARYEITVDGKLRSMRDTKAVVMEAGEFLKSESERRGCGPRSDRRREDHPQERAAAPEVTAYRRAL